MRIALLALLVVVTGAFAYPPIPKPKPKKGDKFDLKGLEGTWTVVSYDIGRPKNAKLAASTITYQTIEIKDGTWTQYRTLPNGGRARTVPFTVSLDATKSPAILDMEYRREVAGGGIASSSVRKGVARLDGEQLTVVYSMGTRERPAKVDGELAVGEYRYVLKREKR